jgi:hypothetical protein
MMAMRKSVRKAKSEAKGPPGASDSHNLTIVFFHSHAYVQMLKMDKRHEQ